jgi:PAS domain S-box-containing protein
MKLGRKINLYFLTIFVLTVFIISLVLGLLFNRTIKEQAYKQIQDINLARAEHLASFLRSEKEVVAILGASTVFRDFLKTDPNSEQYAIQKARTKQRLERSMGSVAQISELFLLDKSGKIVAATLTTEEGLDKSQDPYFLEGQKDVFIKDFYFSQTIKKNTYAVSAPLVDDVTGELLGVIVARLNPETLYRIVNLETALGQTGENFLVNQGRYFITSSRFLGEAVVLKQKITTQNVEDCFADAPLVGQQALSQVGSIATHSNHEIFKSYIDYRGQAIIGTHSYIPEVNWCLITKMDKAEVLQSSYQLRNLSILICFLATIIFLLVIYGVTRQIIKPINILQKGIENIEAGNLEFKNVLNSQDEISGLSASFAKMVLAVKTSRAEVDKKVKEQTKEISQKAQELQDKQKAILNILEDVEEEKIKAESLASIVRNAAEPIIGEDLKGVVTSWNEGAEQLYGYSYQEIIGQSIKKIIPPEKHAEVDNILQTVAGGKSVEHYQTVRVKKDGSLVEVAISVSPIKDLKGKVTGVSVITLDITKEKQIDKAKTEFVSLASHQLRTPLSAINWYAEMLIAGDAGKINTEQKKYLQEIYSGNQRMVDLVNALLNVSRLELGTFTIEPVPTDLKEVCESVLEELKSQIKAKNLKISEKYDPKLPADYQGDPKLLRIVFQNLLSNAVKYTPPQGKIAVAISKKNKKINISVADTGYGIPKQQEDKIFTKLFRADNIREKDAEGTGLGLYIVKAIIDQSQGQVWFKSKENKGTTFSITLPLAGMKKKEGTKQLS